MDQRAVPRRRVVLMSLPERRAVVDRRVGAERRSTLDRRCRPSRPALAETPGEHLRNAMQLLRQLAVEQPASDGADLAAALQRLERALSLLESRSTTL
jgi:hypothetical protein